ncbi:MAG: branched-chain amino acid ABC transporter permease [Lachnospiraceae bacterium]
MQDTQEVLLRVLFYRKRGLLYHDDDITDISIRAIELGSTYALLALGYSMVYGIVGMINFAHGDLLMVGAYTAFFIFAAFKTTPTNMLIIVGVIILTAILVGALGALIEKVAYKPLRNKARLSALITAIGVSMLLKTFRVRFLLSDLMPEVFPAIIPMKVLTVGSINITTIQLVTILTAVVLMIILSLFVNKTVYGKQMRAVQQNKDASSLMGINVNGIISLTFFLGAALAAISGILYASTYPTITLTMGSVLGMKAFICAVLGGIGEIKGAMLGGFVLGIAEMFANYINADFGYGISFIILILVLILRPQGLVGKETIEKV